MPDTTVKLQDITPVKSTFDNDDQILLINPTGEARISKEDFLDAMPDDAITLIGDITTTGIEGDTVAKQLGALENSKAPVITDTASGAIANFPDGADDIPVTSLVANIEPVQSGSGDPAPDNIRPISGWTGCNVTRTGKNLLDQSKCISKRFVNSEGAIANSNDWCASDYTPIKGGQTYTVSGYTATGWAACHAFYDSNKNFISSEYAINHSTFTVPNNAVYVRLSIKSETPTVAQFELGSTATAYEPYQGNTLTVDWSTEAGTVYGGTIDVATGLLTVDRTITSFNGSETWYKDNYIYATGYAGNTALQGACSHFPYVTSNIYNANGVSMASWGFIVGSIIAANYTLDEWKSFLQTQANNGTPVTVAYGIRNPQTYQLTPQEVIKTLLGTNNVWADVGNVSVTYPADTKMFIEKLTMPTEDDLVANQAITSGKYFMIGNSLYLALANIASGAQITIGTNAQRVSLADALNTINS